MSMFRVIAIYMAVDISVTTIVVIFPIDCCITKPRSDLLLPYPATTLAYHITTILITTLKSFLSTQVSHRGCIGHAPFFNARRSA